MVPEASSLTRSSTGVPSSSVNSSVREPSGPSVTVTTNRFGAWYPSADTVWVDASKERLRTVFAGEPSVRVTVVSVKPGRDEATRRFLSDDS